MEIVKVTSKHYRVLQARSDMFTFNEKFRNIRKNMKYHGFECFNCSAKFEDDDRFGLIITSKGNKSVCNKCAKMFENKIRQGG